MASATGLRGIYVGLMISTALSLAFSFYILFIYDGWQGLLWETDRDSKQYVFPAVSTLVISIAALQIAGSVALNRYSRIALLRDAAPFILYLRSFSYDTAARLRAAHSIEDDLATSFISSESTIIALGDQVRFGFSRTTVRNEKWFDEFRLLVSQSAAIVICPIATPNTLRELVYLCEKCPEKTFIGMPPDIKLGRQLEAQFVYYMVRLVSAIIINIKTMISPKRSLPFVGPFSPIASQLWRWSAAKLQAHSIVLPPYNKQGGYYQLRKSEGQIDAEFLCSESHDLKIKLTEDGVFPSNEIYSP